MISLISATWFQPDWPRCISSWQHPVLLVPKMDILPAYKRGLELTTSPILGYVHDDVLCADPYWRDQVEEEFQDENVSLVGFGGGTGHGQLDMYSRGQFEIPSMIRIGFHSNLTDAEQHGSRLWGSIEGAVLDGFVFFARREFMVDAFNFLEGSPISYFLYMEAFCCLARRGGKRIRIAGVASEHLGGRTSGKNPNIILDYNLEHKWLYEEFKDVLPWRV